MAEEGWIFESLIGFLRGPVWNYPVLTFVEQRSSIFDPEEDETNEEEYKVAYGEYKNLVDYMLSSYMEDLGISSTQFEDACKIASQRMKTKIQRALFEQVWAADDYELFKRMMTQKNIDLQLQALELLKEKYGVSLKPGKNDPRQESKIRECEENGEAAIMEKIRQKSLLEHKQLMQELDKENRDLEEALAQSVEEHKKLCSEKNNQARLMDQQIRKSVPETTLAEPEGFSEEFSTVEVSVEKEGEIDEDNEEALQPSEKDEEEIRRRTEYLREQRDKLLALKKAERERALEESPVSRPKSSRAARTAVNQTRILDPQTLTIRKALAEKLKKEVVNQSLN